MSKTLGLDEAFKRGLSELSFSDIGPALPLDSQPAPAPAPASPRPEFTPS